MDPVNQTTETQQVSSQTPVTPEASSQAPKPEVKNNHLTTVLTMALFVLLALAAIIFLYYQNQQLKAMLVDYQTLPSVTPTALPTVSPEPETSPTVSGSPTTSPEATSISTPTMSPTASPTN